MCILDSNQHLVGSDTTNATKILTLPFCPGPLCGAERLAERDRQPIDQKLDRHDVMAKEMSFRV